MSVGKVIRRAWSRRGPTGRKVKVVSYGFTVQIDGKQTKRFNADWTEDIARDELAKFVLGKDRIKAKPITLGEAAARYEQAKVRKRSLVEDKKILRRLLAAFGADTKLDRLTADVIAQYRDQRLAGGCLNAKGEDGKPRRLAVATVNRELSLLRHLLRLANEEWGSLVAVPRIRLGKEPQGRIRWLEPDEEARLLAACAKSQNKQLLPIVTIALETGMRKSELLGLTWDRVDMSRGVIRLEVTKSGKRREIPMRQVVYETLAALPGPHEGRVWRAGNIRKAFETAVAAAKLNAPFTLHCCRHHFASWFVMRGGNIVALQDLLGHASLAMTRKYSHLAPDHLRSEIAKTEKPRDEALRAVASADVAAVEKSTALPIEVSGIDASLHPINRT